MQSVAGRGKVRSAGGAVDNGSSRAKTSEQNKAMPALLGSNGKELNTLAGRGVATVDAEMLDEATAAQRSGAALYFSGGAFEQKVVPLAWNKTGRLCAAAGGRTAVVWDMGRTGSAPPVRRNARAVRLLGHRATINCVAFSPAAEPEEERSSFVLAAEQRARDSGVASSGLVAAGTSGGALQARLATASLDGSVSLYSLSTDREPKGVEVSPGAVLYPVATSPPNNLHRRVQPLLVWGHGVSRGQLFCGANRRVVAYAV